MKTKDIQGRRSRWANPADNPDTHGFNDTRRDVSVYQILDAEHRYKYLFSNWIREILKREGTTKLTALSARLGRLCLAPHYRLYRPEQQKLSLNVSYKHQVYALNDAGYKILVDRGHRQDVPLLPSDHYAHQLLTDLITASIEMGCVDGYEFLSWSDLLNTGKVPEETWTAKNPFKIPVGEEHVLPDGRPFAIRRDSKSLFVLGMEVDRNTEDLTGKSRNAIQKKLRRYKQLYAERAYRSHYGFPNSIVLFVTTNRRHLTNILKLTEKEIGTPTWLLFKCIEDWSTAPHAPEPGSFMFDEPWERVGHPPTTLKELF